MMALAELLARADSEITELARYLDALDADARWAEVGKLKRAQQRMLYEKAAAAPAITLDHFSSGRALEEVIHDGVNTLPVAAKYKRFQKRFCRPEPNGKAEPRLFGYNEGPSRKLIGPGFFVAVPTVERPQWSARGGVVVDYYQVPDGAVAEGWPHVVANDWRLQRFVYFQTRDFMRRVSRHVSIGAAFKRERPLDHYFVLCRRES